MNSSYVLTSIILLSKTQADDMHALPAARVSILYCQRTEAPALIARSVFCVIANFALFSFDIIIADREENTAIFQPNMETKQRNKTFYGNVPAVVPEEDFGSSELIEEPDEEYSVRAEKCELLQMQFTNQPAGMVYQTTGRETK